MTQNIAISAPSHKNLLGYIFATKARFDNRKKNLLSSDISPTCPHNMVNFGPLAADIVSLVWGTPANFNKFRVLALLHGTLVVGVAKLCGVEQRVPPIFGRAAITFSIGPHYYLWSPYVIGQTIIFSSCFFLLLSFFSSPNLSGRRLDVYHTLAHGVALVRI